MVAHQNFSKKSKPESESTKMRENSKNLKEMVEHPKNRQMHENERTKKIERNGLRPKTWKTSENSKKIETNGSHTKTLGGTSKQKLKKWLAKWRTKWENSKKFERNGAERNEREQQKI